MSLNITTDGDGWNGSFTLSVESAARDILSDGSPLSGVSVVSDSDGTVQGTLTAVDDGCLVIDGKRIEISENVTGFHIE